MVKKLKKKSRRKQNRFVLAYKDSWSYLNESRYYFIFVVSLFFLLSLFVFLGLQNNELNKIVFEQLKEIILEFEGLNTFQTVLKIFLNNLSAAFFGIFLGLFFGIFPIMFILFNSYVVGLVARMSVDSEGILVLWQLLPHGIFELPAIFISFGLGIKLGMFVFAKNPWKELQYRFWKSFRVFLLIVLPLLFLAAIIEGILVVLL